MARGGYVADRAGPRQQGGRGGHLEARSTRGPQRFESSPVRMNRSPASCECAPDDGRHIDPAPSQREEHLHAKSHTRSTRARGGGSRRRFGERSGAVRRHGLEPSRGTVDLGGPDGGQHDLYAFRSPDRPDTVTIISNVIPGEDPAAGPMYYEFSPSARYNIYLDRNGDGRAEITYRFSFRPSTNVAFLRNTVQPYTVTRIENGNSQVVASGNTPPNNIGWRTTPGLPTGRSERRGTAHGRWPGLCRPA